MENEQKEKKEVPKVDFLAETEREIYDLTKEEALERLKSTINPKTRKALSDSEQMLNKWCRDGDIEAVRIAKGAPKDRGLRISGKSLEAFILTKTGKVVDLLEELEKTKRDLADARKEIKELKESGIRKPRTSKVKLEEVSFHDNILTFKMDRATHQAIFEDDKIIKIEKKMRGKGFEDITSEVVDDKWNAIVEAKKKL